MTAPKSLHVVDIARVQLRSNRQINAVMIAKNHYREMLDAFLKNSDILYLGSNPTSFAELKKDIPRYRRYRTLFTLMSFAMQELYLAMDLKRNVAYWQILLQKSKIERCRKSRESRFLDISTVARLCSADAQVRGQFVRNNEVPHIATSETH